ncbi:MAG: ACT domain-containing protein, partial [Deinococcus sp.]
MVRDETAQAEGDHLVSVIVRDEPKVLTRITALFGRRAYNIRSLS